MSELSRPKALYRAYFILALGIVGIALGFFGIVAVWMGESDLERMRVGKLDSYERRLTLVGLWLGVASIGIAAIGVAGILAYMSFIS